MAIRVLLVDDHSLFREGLELLLRRLVPEIEILHAVTVDEGLALLSDEARPDLVFTDLSLPGIEGIDALLAVREHAPEVPAIVIAASEEALTVRRAIDHGASAYIFKSTSSQELSAALNIVLEGGVYLPMVALSSEKLPAQQTDLDLTPRQMQVLRSLVRGLANKHIADELNISSETVKTHLKAIYDTLGVNNRTQAVYAIANSGIRLT